MTTQRLIDLSVFENRIVTEYPDTAEEFEALVSDLRGRRDYEDEAEQSGVGYSGPEARGFVEFWGEDWRVHVINPAKAVVS